MQQQISNRSECGKYRSNRLKTMAEQNNSFLCNQTTMVDNQKIFERNWNDIFGHHQKCVCDQCVSKKTLESTAV